MERAAHADSRIEADYLLETPRRSLAASPSSMAGEQSSGTFVAIPGETEELKARAAARSDRLISARRDDERPPHCRRRDQVRSCRASARAPTPPCHGRSRRLGPSLPNLLATVAGNLFELKPVTGLRLLDIRLPREFAAAYPGPRFGVAGTRRWPGYMGGPLIGTIIKPSVGLGPAIRRISSTTLCEAGIDFIKDDELQSDGPHCPFDAGASKPSCASSTIMRDRTGKKVMYAFNITGDIDQMLRRHDCC